MHCRLHIRARSCGRTFFPRSASRLRHFLCAAFFRSHSACMRIQNSGVLPKRVARIVRVKPLDEVIA
jgi:hypothetical protein